MPECFIISRVALYQASVSDLCDRHVGRFFRLSVGLSARKVYCGRTADWIRMPFGMVSGVSGWRGVLDGGGDLQKGRGIFGGEFGRPTVSNGDSATRLFPNYFGQDLFRIYDCRA